MSKKIIAFCAIILLGFVYWCDTKQEVNVADEGKKVEQDNSWNADEIHIAGDNDGEWWITISSPWEV